MRRLLPVLVLAALLGACGGDDGEGSRELLVEAASKTTEAGSARLVFTGSSRSGLPEPIEIRGEGVVDNARRVGRLEFDFRSLAGSLPPGSDVDASDLTGEVIFDGFVFYMRFPVLSQLLEGGREWVKFDVEEIGRAQGIDASSPSSARPTRARRCSTSAPSAARSRTGDASRCAEPRRPITRPAWTCASSPTCCPRPSARPPSSPSRR